MPFNQNLSGMFGNMFNGLGGQGQMSQQNASLTPEQQNQMNMDRAKYGLPNNQQGMFSNIFGGMFNGPPQYDQHKAMLENNRAAKQQRMNQGQGNQGQQFFNQNMQSGQGQQGGGPFGGMAGMFGNMMKNMNGGGQSNQNSYRPPSAPVASSQPSQPTNNRPMPGQTQQPRGSYGR